MIQYDQSPLFKTTIRPNYRGSPKVKLEIGDQFQITAFDWPIKYCLSVMYCHKINVFNTSTMCPINSKYYCECIIRLLSTNFEFHE